MKIYNIKDLKNLPFFDESMLALVAFQQDEFHTGRFEFANGIYINADPVYDTKDRVKDNRHFEYHEKMVDVQIMLRGKETILLAPVESLKEEVSPYDPKRDIAFVDGKETDSVDLTDGTFVIICPGEAHVPCLNCGGVHKIEKLVAKIPWKLYKKTMGIE